MPLEDLVGGNKFIDDLVREWPLGIDPFAEGDDHIRGLKNVLKNSFPTVAEARRPVSFREGANHAEEIVSAFEFPAGTELQRPSTPVAYDIRVNTDTGLIEWWDGSAWVPAVAMMREDNVRIGKPNATFSPSDQWSSDRVPQANDIGPALSFNMGDGPGGINMGAFRWMVSPDDTGRFRLAIRRNNQGFGNPLIVGAGVMVPTSDTPPDSFDPGRGWVNAQNGVSRQGLEYTRGWKYTDIVNLSGNSAVLATTAAEPDLADAMDIEVLCDGVGSSSNDEPIIRLGTGGSVVSTGYRSSNQSGSTTSLAVSSITYGFPITRDASYISSYELGGVGRIARWDPAQHHYKFDMVSRRTEADDQRQQQGVGSITLAGAMDRVAIEVAGSGNLRGQARLRYR